MLTRRRQHKSAIGPEFDGRRLIRTLDGRFLHARAAQNAFRAKSLRKKPERTNEISSAECGPLGIHPKRIETIRSPMAGDVTFAKNVVKSIL